MKIVKIVNLHISWIDIKFIDTLTKEYNNVMNKFKKLLLRTWDKLVNRSLKLILVLYLLIWPSKLYSLESESGEDLFKMHCAACHVNGGNIIRRGKTLKLSALNRNGINNAEDIAYIARNGMGIMSGYAKDLEDGGDIKVSEWIWIQAQNAWIQG